MSNFLSKCGQCEFQGSSEEYLAHKCNTGFKPTDIKHQDALTDGRFSKQSEKALERGAARKGEKAHPAAGGDA